MGKKEKQELQETEEKAVLNEVEAQHEELQSRIDSLYGMGDEPVRRHVELSDEEKREIRKKMILLIWFCVFMGGLMIFNTIYPINELFSKKEETVKVVEKEPLPDLPSGDVPLDNEEIENMIDMFTFDVNNPLYEANIGKIFAGNKNIEDMDFELQMFLLTSNDKFNKYMEEKTIIDEYFTTNIEVEITISTKQLDNIINEVFGKKLKIDYQNFKYYYNYGDNNIVYFDAVINEDTNTYTFTAADQQVKSKIEMYMKPFAASNIDNNVYIKYYVVYINENGIYSDVNANNLLSNDVTKIKDFISYGSRGEIMFKRVEDIQNNSLNYHLISTKGM